MLNTGIANRNFAILRSGGIARSKGPDLKLSNSYGFQPTGPVNAKYEWLWSCVYSLQDSLVRVEKAPHLFPTWSLRSPQIETSHPVFLDSLAFQGTPMVHSVMAYQYPPTGANIRHPFIIPGVRQEMLLMIFHVSGKR